jgi:hypothetical protein
MAAAGAHCGLCLAGWSSLHHKPQACRWQLARNSRSQARGCTGAFKCHIAGDMGPPTYAGDMAPPHMPGLSSHEGWAFDVCRGPSRLQHAIDVKALNCPNVAGSWGAAVGVAGGVQGSLDEFSGGPPADVQCCQGRAPFREAAKELVHEGSAIWLRCSG